MADYRQERVWENREGSALTVRRFTKVMLGSDHMRLFRMSPQICAITADQGLLHSVDNG